MNSSTNNIFQQFLMEEFEKQKDKNQMDVVAAKRQQFSALVDKAHEELRNKLYTTAAGNYYNVVNCLRTDPYPDEFQLSPEADYTIKCCFCYSSLVSPERFKNEEVNNVLLDVIKELNDNFRTRLFPMFLLVLLNFHRKDWLATLTWCNEIGKYTEEDTDQGTEVFKEILPSPSEITLEVETCEEIAFFGYGETVTRNTLLKPRFEKYKDWSYKLNDFIASKIVKLKSPVSEIDLHTVFHQEIFPVWCLANGTEYSSYYNDKFASKCTQCMRGKLRNAVCEKNEDLTLDRVRLEKYVEQCAQFYHRFATQFMSDISVDVNNGRFKPLRTPDVETKKSNNAPAKKQNCSTSCQTEKTKTNNKHIQTEAKKNAEAPPNTDPQILTALLEIKNKCLTLQEKKDETITKLNRRITELQDKINKENIARKNAEHEFEKKANNFKFEIQKLKEQLADSEKKRKVESEKNVCFQKLLMEQINDKYNMHKQRYKTSEQQARFMVAYLKDLVTFLTPKSIPNDKTCRTHIGMWENKLQTIQQSLEQFNTFYQNIRVDMVNSGIYEIMWPEVPDLPKYDDNLIFLSFKGAIRNIIQTEEKLYWKYSMDCQVQMQHNSLNNFTYNMQRPPFPQQNNVFVGPRLVYSNPAAVPMPIAFPPQQPQKRERFPSYADIPPPMGVGVDPRMSKSMEFLDKAAGGSVNSAYQARNQESSTKGACASKNAGDKKEMILLDYVLEQCPGITEEDVTLALLKLLEENKGSLSEIPKDKIVEDVKIILRMKKQAAWVTPKSPHVDWHNDHTENECAICFEDFSLLDKYTLPCQHEYHKECIRKWLRTSSVCPICRIHSVFDEEFPPLH